MPFASKTAFIGSTATLPPQIVTPPLNLTGSTGDGTVTLRWVPSPSPNTTGVRVYRDEQLVATLGPTVTTYRNTGLTNGQSYRYSLEALLTGWSGALLSADSIVTHRKVRTASHAARQAMAAGATPHQALLEHIGVVP